MVSCPKTPGVFKLTETLTSPASAAVCRASDVAAPAAMRMIQDVVAFIASRMS